MADQQPPHQSPSDPVGSPPPPAYGQAYGYGYGGPGQYGGPFAPPVPQQGGVLKWVLLAVGLVLLLTCGGCFAVVAVLANETRSTVQREIDRFDGPGTAGEQIVVVAGSAFQIGDLDFQDGWTVNASGRGVAVEGLVVNNTGDVAEPFASVGMTFHRGGRRLGGTVCVAPLVEPGAQVWLTCETLPRKARNHDRITVTALF